MLFADWPKQHFLNSTSEWVYLACSEHTSRSVSTPRVRYIRACIYFCLLSIRCFNVVHMVFNASFNNISVISWRSVLLVEETGETHSPAQVTDKLCHKMLYWVHIAWTGFELTTFVMIGNDGIGSCKFNYHAITTTTIPFYMSWKRQSMALVDQVLKHSLRVINSMWHILWYFSSFGLQFW